MNRIYANVMKKGREKHQISEQNLGKCHGKKKEKKKGKARELQIMPYKELAMEISEIQSKPNLFNKKVR